MKAIVTTGDGNCELRDVQVPKPGPKEILVKVYAAAQNPSDCTCLEFSIERPKLPLRYCIRENNAGLSGCWQHCRNRCFRDYCRDWFRYAPWSSEDWRKSSRSCNGRLASLSFQTNEGVLIIIRSLEP